MASRLDRFHVSISGGANTISGLYANGRQQCKVRIEVLKVGSDFKVQPLSAAEIASLTLLPVGVELFPPQKPGWFCDDAPNPYDEANDSLAVARLSPEAPPANEAPQTFYRYLRCDLRKATTGDFMACITLDDGQKISTHFSSSEMSFNSSVTIKTRSPYVLQPRELELQRTIGFSKEFGKKRVITVEQFNWYLPPNLRVESLSFVGFPTVVGVNPDVHWSYVANHGDLFASGMVNKDTRSLCLGDLMSGGPFYIPDWAERSYNIGLIDAGQVAIRTLRYFCQGSGATPDRWQAGECTLIDNFGCESRFALIEGSKETGYAPVLTAINP